MFGGLHRCPLCWNEPEECRCTEAEIAAFHKDTEKKQREIEEFNKAEHKHPIWEAWEIYREKYK